MNEAMVEKVAGAIMDAACGDTGSDPWAVYARAAIEALGVDTLMAERDEAVAGLAELDAMRAVVDAAQKLMSIEIDEMGCAFCPIDQLAAELELSQALTDLARHEGKA